MLRRTEMTGHKFSLLRRGKRIWCTLKLWSGAVRTAYAGGFAITSLAMNSTGRLRGGTVICQTDASTMIGFVASVISRWSRKEICYGALWAGGLQQCAAEQDLT